MHRPRNKRWKRVRASHTHTHMYRHPDCAVMPRWSVLNPAYCNQCARDLSVVSALGGKRSFRKRIMTEINFTFSLRPSPPPPLELAFDLAAGDRCHGALILENLFCLMFLKLLLCCGCARETLREYQLRPIPPHTLLISSW